MRIAADLEIWMDNHNIKQVQEIVGSLESLMFVILFGLSKALTKSCHSEPFCVIL